MPIYGHHNLVPMEIPAFFTSFRDDQMVVSDGRFSKGIVKEGTRFAEYSKTVYDASKSEGRPAVVIDCNSLIAQDFSEKVMKHMRIQSTELWLMTCIRTVDDVFDAFNKDAEFVLSPYHYIESDAELKDICEVSDKVVPVIYVRDGKAILRKGRKADVLEVLEKLVRIGFYRNCILDPDESLDGYSWSIVSADYPSTLPFMDSQGPDGFQNIIRPYLL